MLILSVSNRSRNVKRADLFFKHFSNCLADFLLRAGASTAKSLARVNSLVDCLRFRELSLA